MKKKIRGISLLPILIFVIGTVIVLYPTVSNYYNYIHQSNMIMEYVEKLDAMDNEDIQQLWDEAVRYNRDLYRAQIGDDLPEDALKNYADILRVADNGMMGYIDIPKISVHLPIYHGTSAGVLQNGVGHLEWSSFPVGGENTHTVLTGHTGLPSARLFTDLDRMEVGDTFILRIVGVQMTYEVDQVLTVLPYEIDSLSISRGEDICTLATCTPYGVNSHRLLIRGHRIENAEEISEEYVEEAAEQNARTPMVRMILIALGILIILLIVLFWDNLKGKFNSLLKKKK